MRRRTALVTGATGFVGSHLARHLLADDWDVHAIVRPASNLTPLREARDELAVHVHDGSMESMQAILAVAAPDVVFHLASLFLSTHEAADVGAMIRSNVLFGTQLVEASSRQEVSSFVNTGTSWQHYEGIEYSPVNLYAATKQAFEQVVQFYVEAWGLKVITLKLSDTYGPDDPRPKLFNLLKKVASEGTALDMSAGEQRIDLVHVDDVVQAYVLAAERLSRGEVRDHERYAVSSMQPVRLRELVEAVEGQLGRALPITWGGRPYRPREVMEPWVGSPLPGWNPQIELRHGVAGLFQRSGS